ncbi:MAG TPA: hypothetical protein VFQ68_19005 [Streptosporangiaceae bacterium]|nr:hypothetical protein [Streptosporangiaceae bacterium]
MMVMDPVTVATAVTAVAGMLGTLVTAGVRGRTARAIAREAARRDHVRYLRSGSRIIDLGDRGVMIEVGNPAGREAAPDEPR